MEIGEKYWIWDKTANCPSFITILAVREDSFDFSHSSKVWTDIPYSSVENKLFHSFSDVLVYKLAREEISTGEYSMWEETRQRIASSNLNDDFSVYQTIYKIAKANKSILPRRYSKRVTVCYYCGEELNFCPVCSTCGWMICPRCGSCSSKCVGKIIRQGGK